MRRGLAGLSAVVGVAMLSGVAAAESGPLRFVNQRQIIDLSADAVTWNYGPHVTDTVYRERVGPGNLAQDPTSGSWSLPEMRAAATSDVLGGTGARSFAAAKYSSVVTGRSIAARHQTRASGYEHGGTFVSRGTATTQFTFEVLEPTIVSFRAFSWGRAYQSSPEGFAAVEFGIRAASGGWALGPFSHSFRYTPYEPYEWFNVPARPVELGPGTYTFSSVTTVSYGPANSGLVLCRSDVEMQVVPAPGGAAAVAMAGLVALRRRRGGAS